MRTNTNSKQAAASRREWLAQAGCLGIGLLQLRPGRAGEPAKKKPAAKTHYLVSAVLREGVQDFTFRLVHSVQSAHSVDEATGMFTRLALEKYPGYAVAQTTVTDITLPPGLCAANKPNAPRKPAQPIYVVSAVMSKDRSDPDTLLVNGWLPGNTANEALGRVLRDVAARYPNFAPASTLVTELDLTLAGCPAPGPAAYHGERA